jgi:alkylhydroperoxidase family enzyme
MATRQVADVNNFWKALAIHPPTLRRTWESLKEVMAEGALDPLTKELLYLAVARRTAATTASPATRRRPWPRG